MTDRFTPSHRGGSGPPLLCLHGFMDTWRTWELVLPALERAHDVLAPTLPGHAGGPPPVTGTAAAVDELERTLDAAGLDAVHIVGNSLGGYLALQLAARGRATSVVALAPAGGWARGGEAFRELAEFQLGLYEAIVAAAPSAEEIVSTDAGRRRTTQYLAEQYEHIPAELLAHLVRGAAECRAPLLLERALAEEWSVDAARIACPVRIVWGAEDKILPWPSAAARYREEWLPHADWVELDGVGHCPQLDVPLETAQLVLGFTT